MRAAVRRFHSPDADLDTFSPVDPGDFALLVQAMLAPEGSDGEESFDVLVCTPVWLARTVAAQGRFSAGTIWWSTRGTAGRFYTL